MPSEPTLQRDGARRAAAWPLAGRARRSLATILLGALGLVLLAALGLWTYGGVKASIESARADFLRAALDAKVAALKVEGAPGGARRADFAVPAVADEPEAAIDAYAFDANGLLLSPGRHRDTIAAAGLDHWGARGVALRDPGRDLVASPVAPEDLADQPLTRLVDQAIRARSAADPRARRGVLLAPYRNYVGQEVIGAWQWLPAHDLGVAVEAPAAAAYAPMRYLAIAVQVIFAMVLVAVAIVVGASFSFAELRREERQLGQYRLEGKIEEGGMATVHRAVHALLKRPTAIKILKPHLATEELIARFEREVTLASRLQHPATVEIFDYGRTRSGTFYYAMEFIDGLTLAQIVERHGALPVPRVAHVLKQVCESLREAHGKGLVHRDVKPQNIMLCERGGESDVVKVLDWGLIKDVRAAEGQDITRYARVLGTPLYMPPERVRDPAQADPLVDIYGLGAVAYLLLAGRRLFEAPNDFDLQRLVVEVDAPRVAQLAPQPIPPALDELIARCLAKARAARPQSVDEMIEVFVALLRERPWTQEDAARWWRDRDAGIGQPKERTPDEPQQRPDPHHPRREPAAAGGPAPAPARERARSVP
jgi:serine/threonine-protein kinase